MVPARADRDWLGAFLNEGQLLTLALAGATSWLAIRTANLARVVEEASSWADALQALFYVGGAWLWICILRAPFMIVRDERKLGRWYGHRFVYHAPQLVATERFENEDGRTQVRTIQFDHPGPNAFVTCQVRAEGEVTRRVRTRFINGRAPPPYEIVPPAAPNQFTMDMPPIGEVGFRLGPWPASNLFVRIEPETVPVILRVYALSFFLGKDDDTFK